MKKVWKCDHCSQSNKDPTKIKEHEKTCTFNPEMRTCYTCRNRKDGGSELFGWQNECKINLSVVDAEDNGNCKGWIKQE